MGPKKFTFPKIPNIISKPTDDSKDSKPPQANPDSSNTPGPGTSGNQHHWNPLASIPIPLPSLPKHKDPEPSGQNAKKPEGRGPQPASPKREAPLKEASPSPPPTQRERDDRNAAIVDEKSDLARASPPPPTSSSAEVIPTVNANSSNLASGSTSDLTGSGSEIWNMASSIATPSPAKRNDTGPPRPRPSCTDTCSLSTSTGTAFSKSHLTMKAFRDTPQQPLTYSWCDINVSTKPKNLFACCKKSKDAKVKTILKNVTGIARPGKILALMGASGAGKSSLLNVLTCRSPPKLCVSGDIFINGVAVDRDMLNSVSAYVQQSDFLVGSLTPREHLRFQATLRMDQRIPLKVRMERVEDVIKEMGLSTCAEVVIGIPGRIKGLSGGQQKRLSIASELLTDPGILFLDEPTTGLDFFMATSLVKLLKQMSENGKTIICTIHQPSSNAFALFDRLCLLSEGRVAYTGDCSAAISFLTEQGYPCPSDYNPADFFIFTLCIRPGMEEIGHERSQAICDAFEKSETNKLTRQAAEDNRLFGYYPRDAVEAKSIKKPSFIIQLKALFLRSWKTVIRDPLLLQIQIGQMILLALVLGTIFYNEADHYNQESVQNISGFFFLVLANLTWASVFSVANVFWGEIDVFVKEYYDGTYRLDTYYISKLLAEIPVYTLLPCILMGIAYWLVGLTLLCDRFMIAMVIAILISNISTGVGYLISLSTPSLQACLLLAPAFLLPFVLVGGHFVNKDSIPVYLDWLKHVSWFLYGFEAFSINQWEDVKSISCEADPKMGPCIIKNGEDALKSLSFKQDHFHFSIFMLCALLVGFRLLAFCSLWIKVKKQLV